jgi:hypothetical protein
VEPFNSRAVGGGVRSLGVVEEVVRSERAAQLQYFDALDAKAGVMLGFAGALAALAPRHVNLVVEAGRGVALAGALLALRTFWPRRLGTVDLRAFRDRYLAAEPELARLRLADTQVSIAEELAVTLHRKASRLKAAMSFVAIAAMLVGLGLLVDWFM